jgi:SAM-dependent methyltransferase
VSAVTAWAPAAPPVLRSRCGVTVALDVERWRADADQVERALLDTLADPVMDVGCGPGRIVAALAEDGRVALGVDVSPAAVAETRRRGAAALGRSIFAPLPGERRWASVVLFDGNIGIGGDPVALLARVADLLAPGGAALIEVDPPGVASQTLTVRIEHADHRGPWFPWARVSADDIDPHLLAAGLRPDGIECHDARWFARASKPALR